MATKQTSLLEYAVDGANAAAHLATGLAHAGADKKIVDTVQQCATILHQAAKALGSGPPLDQASGAPAAQAPPPNQGQPQAAPAPAPKKQSAHHAMLAAAHATQAAMAASGKNS